LNDVETAINSGNRKEAEAILMGNQLEGAKLKSNLFEIKQLLEKYTEHMQGLRACLNPEPWDSNDVLAHDRPKEDFLVLITMARANLKNLHKHMQRALAEELRLEK